MASAPSPPQVERTLAVFLAPENLLAVPRVRCVVLEAGFAVLGEDQLSGQKLEEAGLDLGLAVGKEEQRSSDDLVHTVWVLERAGAVGELKELRAGTLANEFPNLRVFAAPSATAADLAVEVLFPSLPATSAAQSPSAVPFPSTNDADDKPKPFALSNLAFIATQDATPSKRGARQLSPSIENALAELEQREELARMRKLSRSSHGSTASPATPSMASPLSALRPPPEVAQPIEERRVFTSRSPEPEDGAEAEVGNDSLAAKGDEPKSPEAEMNGALPPPASPSPTGLPAPELPRTVSAVSSVSVAPSSTSSFRARPVPSAAPAVQPRLTKTAALRLGISLPASTPRRKTTSSAAAASDSSSSAAPARRTSVVPTPRSLAQPAITPRMTKTAALRTSVGGVAAPLSAAAAKAPRAPQQPAAPQPAKRQSISTAARAAVDRLARRHTASASASAPRTAPAAPAQVRMSRAALLRQGVAAPRPAAARARAPAPAPAPAADKPRPRPAAGRESVSAAAAAAAALGALPEPVRAPRLTKAANLRVGGAAGTGTGAGTGAGGRRVSSVTASGRPDSATATAAATEGALDASTTVPRATPRRVSTAAAAASVSALKPAAVTPGLNKAAELRRAKLAAASVSASPGWGKSGKALTAVNA
ncbi:hypothetical protein JCM3770_003838 [Rhodotorula araucariae]